MKWPDLPVGAVLPALLARLEAASNAVLVAPPGAGKTTTVPLALLNAPWRDGRKIIMLEPRRIAARAAATRMAQLLGEGVGERLGYRMRAGTRVSAATDIEVVTGGVFARMLQADPALDDVAVVIFDEFHERSLDTDLAMALCLDLQSALREDLRLLAMSATLDGAAVADLMDAEVIESEGRAHPVTITYRDGVPSERLEDAVAAACAQVVQEGAGGDVLVFLPGRSEIERCRTKLAPFAQRHAVALHRLYGAVGHGEQQAALAPDPDGRRKIVLASAIAETSLTIDGVDIVIDAGLARLPVFEPATGLSRLQTVRASRAAIAQRAGRAGRLRPGRALRLWREQQNGALPAQAPPEILDTDLAGLLLTLAEWGVTDPATLRWLDTPPAPALAEARALLIEREALREDSTITTHGRAMAALPLDPRLAHMVLCAAETGRDDATRAVTLALLLQDHGARVTDLAARQPPRDVIQQAARIAKGLNASAGGADLSPGHLLAFAYPDRIAKAAGPVPNSDAIRFKLANGRAASIDGTDPLAAAPWIVAADMIGEAGRARITAAAALSRAEIDEHFAHLIEDVSQASFDAETGSLQATRARRLGAIALSKPQPVPVGPATALPVLLEAVRERGLSLLPWSDAETTLLHRLTLIAPTQHWPAMDEAALLTTLDDWLTPFLDGATSLTALKGSLGDALLARAGYPAPALLERLAPTHLQAPSGSSVPLAYTGESVRLSIRPQELFGLDQHPTVLDGALPVDLELLSPAGRPIQLTRDLPGFWRGSWRDVRADLRGRYPKHPWPEDPLSEPPTRRVKPRK